MEVFIIAREQTIHFKVVPVGTTSSEISMILNRANEIGQFHVVVIDFRLLDFIAIQIEIGGDDRTAEQADIIKFHHHPADNDVVALIIGSAVVVMQFIAQYRGYNCDP